MHAQARDSGRDYDSPAFSVVFLRVRLGVLGARLLHGSVEKHRPSQKEERPVAAIFCRHPRSRSLSSAVTTISGLELSNPG